MVTNDPAPKSTTGSSEGVAQPRLSSDVPPLLVLKGSRVREYLQQNQRLLAAPIGGITRTRYSLTWVSSRVDLAALTPGRPAVIIFTDAPYRKMCPVRHARIASATREGSSLDLTLSLEEFVDPEAAGRDCLRELEAAARAVGGPQPFDDKGRKVFLDLASEGWDVGRVPLQIPGHDQGALSAAPGPPAHSETLAWRSIVDFLATSEEEREHYASAFFFRPVSLRRVLDDRTKGNGHLSIHRATGPELLWPGEIDLELDATYRLELSCYNPHRTDDEGARARLSPDGAGRFSFPDPLGTGLPRLLREGLVQLHFVPRRAGITALELAVTPGGETSSFLRLEALRVLSADGETTDTADGHAREQPAQTPISIAGDAGRGIEAQELLRLDDWVQARMAPNAAAHLQLFRDFLTPWSGKSLTVAERHASLAFAQKQWAEVEHLLRDRDDLSQEARHQRILASVELHRNIDVAAEASQLSWTGEFDPHFEHLLRLTPGLDIAARNGLVERMPFAIWGDDKSCRFLRTLMDTPCDQELAVYIGDSLLEHSALFGLDSDEVLAWLLEQVRRFDVPSPELVSQIVHWTANVARPDAVVELLAGGVLAQLCRQEGIEAAAKTVDELRPCLDFPARMRLDVTLAGLQARSSSSRVCEPTTAGYSPLAEALTTLLGLLEGARRAGAVWEGNEVADRIRGILGTTPSLEADVRAWAEEELAGWLEFLDGRERYRTALMDEVAQKGLELGARFGGRTLHVFTGHAAADSLADRYEVTGDFLGLPTKVHSLSDRGPLEGLQGGRDLVVVITRWAGHADTDAIHERCKKAKVPCYIMPKHVVEPARVVLELWERGVK